jgi:hypothetical protein
MAGVEESRVNLSSFDVRQKTKFAMPENSRRYDTLHEIRYNHSNAQARYNSKNNQAEPEAQFLIDR